MLEFLKDLESYKDLKTVLELEENTEKRFLFNTMLLDDIASSFIDLSNDYDYEHGIITSDEIEHFLSRKAAESDEPFTTVLMQGQGVNLLNEEYYYIDGYDNLQNLEVSRLNAELFDLKQEIKSVLNDEIEEFIQNHFENSNSDLILNDNRVIRNNIINYSINEREKTVVYGAEISDILAVLIATLTTSFIIDLHKTT